ncbi:ParB N-terminal domain-containing protein [Methylobacterium sp. E-025]|uniref:ParB/RepB/Spo0J family partition protein n=1 Tax=Methylobacterium sp. E-025 TaxID=2836561 RepID=UPI001FBA0C83|nr:ParB N-terminal domain-containing protein [Methylobacterium sp. E-025]MCJ2112752.1 ParB N-terminal domain-containing protein [Methylobacterium sp. E-025]
MQTLVERYRLAHSSNAAARIVEIPLDDIYDGDRLRDIDPAWAAALAADFEAGGEPPPIVVRPRGTEDAFDQEYGLVAGGHRHAAYRLLGRRTILAEIRPITRLQGRLVEIEENLFRHELNALDRAVFLSEHKRVWAEIHPDAAHGGDRKSKKDNAKIKSQGLRLDPKRFTAEAAERCGLSERTVQAALALVEALSPEAITLLRGTDTARNASDLQRIATEPAERQVRLARLLRDGKAANVAKARLAAGDAPAGEGDPQEELFRRIVANWERLDAKGRKRFLEHAGLVARERKPRDRMPTISEIIGDPRQVDIEDAIEATRKGGA